MAGMNDLGGITENQAMLLHARGLPTTQSIASSHPPLIKFILAEWMPDVCQESLIFFVRK
jgi:hypothetical protein